MPDSEARMAEIVARLSAVGLRPVRKDRAGIATVEAVLPPSFPDSAWTDVLAALESADSFGLVDSAARGRSLWAAVHPAPRTDADATRPDAAHGPPVQP